MNYHHRDNGNHERVLEMLIKGEAYSKIGDSLGFSRQRAQQLVCLTKGERAKFLSNHGEFCDGCGESVGHAGHIHHKKARINFNALDNLELLCISCHRKVHVDPHRFCSICSKPLKRGHRQYCSRECQHIGSTVELTCKECGTKFYRLKSVVAARYKFKKHWDTRTDNYFCSRVCQGKWLGKHYGWGRLESVNVTR